MDCSVSAKVNEGDCQGREGRYAISEVSASLSSGKVQLRCVTSKCHRGILVAEIPPESMDELAIQWLLARSKGDTSNLKVDLMYLKVALREAKVHLLKVVDEALSKVMAFEKNTYGRKK